MLNIPRILDFNNRKVLFALIALVWTGIIAYNLYSFGVFNRGSGGQAQPSKKREARTSSARPFNKSVRKPYPGVKKDIFVPFRQAPKASAAPVVKPPELPPMPAPPSKIQVFASEIRFLGFLEKGRGMTVFLSRGADVFIVKQGDVLSGFKVVEMNEVSMTLSDAGTGESVKVELVR